MHVDVNSGASQSLVNRQGSRSEHVSPQQHGPCGASIASLVLGIIGLFAWCVPLIGVPITIIGIVMGVKGRRRSPNGVATAGMILSIIGLVLSALLFVGNLLAYVSRV